MASQHHPPFDGATNVTATINDESAPESHRLKVLNWNVNSDEVDGGSPLRFKAIISEIEASGADAILLQEVALNFKKMLQQQLGHVYDFKDCSADSKESFFVMIMLRKCRMAALSCKRIDFQGGGRSNMGRHVLSVETQLAGWDTSVVLMTAHLESCKENSEIRMLQYEQLLRLIVKAPATCVQICGGDFNLREAEDKKARKRLKDSGVDVELAVDTFDAAGRPFEASCTWRRKMDKTAGAKSIQARFDRQMFRSGDADFSLVVEDGVSLLGLQDVSGIDGETACRAGFTTPSDHMGILCQYAYALGGGSKVATPVASGLLLSSERCTESPIVLVLIGAPGSGKTTLAAHLSSVFARISQDALGSRSKCEEAAKSELESGRSIVIDRCNFDARQRSTWISIARNFAARAIAVQLEVPLSICSHRVAARRGHEGGVEGDSQAAKDIVTKLHGDQQPVADDEGFDHVRVFRHMSTPENSAMELLTEFGMQPKNRSLSSKITLSCPTPLPYRVTSASRAIGAQIDSSDSESSQERRAIALSLSSEHVSAPTPASAPAHVVASSVHKACASDDDCILVQHEPPRGHVVVSCCNCESLFLPVLCRKRPLPGMLAAAAQVNIYANVSPRRGLLVLIHRWCVVHLCVITCPSASQGEEGSRCSVRT
jgi:predicted kinase/endonuclease/exonuclease/phosphatase family metal-dependent hydrolase